MRLHHYNLYVSRNLLPIIIIGSTDESIHIFSVTKCHCKAIFMSRQDSSGSMVAHYSSKMNRTIHAHFKIRGKILTGLRTLQKHSMDSICCVVIVFCPRRNYNIFLLRRRRRKSFTSKFQ